MTTSHLLTAATQQFKFNHTTTLQPKTGCFIHPWQGSRAIGLTIVIYNSFLFIFIPLFRLTVKILSSSVGKETADEADVRI